VPMRISASDFDFILVLSRKFRPPPRLETPGK
jgi:hypothetical protein